MRGPCGRLRPKMVLVAALCLGVWMLVFRSGHRHGAKDRRRHVRRRTEAQIAQDQMVDGEIWDEFGGEVAEVHQQKQGNSPSPKNHVPRHDEAQVPKMDPKAGTPHRGPAGIEPEHEQTEIAGKNNIMSHGSSQKRDAASTLASEGEKGGKGGWQPAAAHKEAHERPSEQTKPVKKEGAEISCKHLMGCPEHDCTGSDDDLAAVSFLLVVFGDKAVFGLDGRPGKKQNWWDQFPQESKHCTLLYSMEYQSYEFAAMQEANTLEFLSTNYGNLPKRLAFLSAYHSTADSADKKYLLMATPGPETGFMPFPGPYLRGFTFSSYGPNRRALELTLHYTEDAWEQALIAAGEPTQGNPLITDTTLYSGGQFIVNRELVLARPKAMYLSLLGSAKTSIERVRLDNTGKSPTKTTISLLHSRAEMQRIWHHLFTQMPELPPNVFVDANQWRARSHSLVCSAWNCSCHGLAMKLRREPAVEDGEMYHWWINGNSNAHAYFVVESDAGSAIREFFTKLYPEGRSMAGYGPCVVNKTEPEFHVSHPVDLRKAWEAMMGV